MELNAHNIVGYNIRLKVDGLIKSALHSEPLRFGIGDSGDDGQDVATVSGLQQVLR